MRTFQANWEGSLLWRDPTTVLHICSQGQAAHVLHLLWRGVNARPETSKQFTGWLWPRMSCAVLLGQSLTGRPAALQELHGTV